MLNKIINKIKNLIKFVVVKKHIDKRRVEVEYFDIKGKKAIALIPYGTHCKIKSEIKGIAFQQEGYEDSLFVLPIDLENIDSLDDDEVAYGIPSKTARVKFDKNGNIFVNGQDGTSYIELDKDGNLKGNVKGIFDLTEKYGNTIKSGSTGIKLNDNWEILL